MNKINNDTPTFFKDIDILYEGSGHIQVSDINVYHSHFRIIFFEDKHGILNCNSNKHEVLPNQVIVIRPNRIYKIDQNLEGAKYYDFNFLDKKSAYNVNSLFEYQYIFNIDELEYFSNCFKMALEEESKELGSKILLLSGLGFIFLSLIFRNMYKYETSSMHRPNVSRNNIFLISEIEESLSNDFVNNSKINNLAFAVGISENKLYKVIKDTFGISPKEWIMELKIQKIKIMLVERKTYHEIAEKLAFCSVSHMSSVFKKHTGYTPNNFLKEFANK